MTAATVDYGHGVPVVDIRDLDADGFGEARKGGIGASDAAAILGIPGRRTALDVWRSMTGRAKPWNGNRFTTWGHRLEDAIAQGFAEDAAVHVEPCHHILAHPDVPYVRATPDRLATETVDSEPVTGGVEVKNVDAHMADEWAGHEDDGEFPDGYHAQVQHQLLVTGWPFVHLVALIGGNDLRWRRILPDPDVHAAMLDVYAEFWSCVTRDVPPAANGRPSSAAKSLQAIYASANPEWQVPCDDLADTFRQLKAKKTAAKQLDAEIDDLANTIKARLGNGCIALVNGKPWATWKPQNRRSLDRALIADALGVPADQLLDEYGTTPAEPTRTFLLKDKAIR